MRHIYELDIKAGPTSPKGQESQNQNLYFITYQPDFSGPRDIISKNSDFLTRSNDTKHLKDLLRNARVIYQPKEKIPLDGFIAHSKPCTTKNCRYCPKLNRSWRIMSTFSQRSYSSKISIDSQNGNLIYCITCKACKVQYVGQTKIRLMGRFQGHFYNTFFVTLLPRTTRTQYANTSTPQTIMESKTLKYTLLFSLNMPIL